LGLKVLASWLVVTGVDYHVGVREEALQDPPILTQQVGDLDPFDQVPGAILFPNVEQLEVITLPKGRE
jgi:hypothetical protein